MEQKTALVTGASHGIGKAIAVALAKAGYRVGINYCNNEAGAMDTLAQVEAVGGQGLVLQADVGDMDQLASLFDRFYQWAPAIDLLVNNAGVSLFYDILEITPEQWEHVTNTDWKGTFFGTQFAARNMVANKKHGVIINMASNHVDGCFPNANIYAPSKAAVTKFTENAAMELAKYGIRVVAIAPGYTNVWADDHPLQEIRKITPLQRFATPEEIAEIIVFVASEKCAYMTGNRVVVDGGALLPVVTENTLENGRFPAID